MTQYDPPPFDSNSAARPPEMPEPLFELPPPKPLKLSRLELIRLREDEKLGLRILSDREQAALAPLSARPEVKSLKQLLDERSSSPSDRIAGMSMVGGNTLLFASYKTGKTVLAINIVRALVDGVDFLGTHEVKQLDGPLVYWNFELPADQFTQWLEVQGIKHLDRVIPLNLRGRPTYVQKSSDFEWLLEQLATYEAEAIVIDPLAVAIKGDPNRGDVAHEFTQVLDDLKFVSGVKDLYMTSHTGHPRGATRSGVQTNLWAAGHSRFMGWADALWTYVEGRNGARLLSAKGRYDADVPEMELAFDEQTKQLSFEGWSGRRVRAEVAPQEDPCDLVLQFLEANPGSTTRSIREGVTGSSDTLDECLAALIEDGSVRWEMGQRGAHLHYAVEPGDLDLTVSDDRA